MKTVLEELVEARGLIAAGWVQGNMMLYLGPPAYITTYCMLGALQQAHGDRVAWGGNFAPVAWALGEALPAYSCMGIAAPHFIVEFNDRPGRTQQEVLAVFDLAILNQRRKDAVKCLKERAQDTDLIQHEETDHGLRPIRPISVFQLPEFNPKQEHEPDLHVSWDRRLVGSIRRQSEGVAG